MEFKTEQEKFGAGEIMELHPEMKLIDYGFSYRHDPVFPQDDITWFLMERGE